MKGSTDTKLLLVTPKTEYSEERQVESTAILVLMKAVNQAIANWLLEPLSCCLAMADHLKESLAILVEGAANQAWVHTTQNVMLAAIG